MRAPLRRRFDLRGAVDYTPIPTSIDVEEAKVHFSLAGAKLLGCWVATQTPASLLDTRARSTLKTKGAWASKTSRSVSTSSSSAPGAPVLFRRRSARFA